MKTVLMICALAVCLVVLQSSCENLSNPPKKTMMTPPISTTVAAAETNRLQIVGTVHMTIEYGLSIQRGLVYLLKDEETNETYLVGFGEAGIVTFANSEQPVVLKKSE